MQPQHHQASTTKFDRALDMLLCDRTPWPLPHPLKPIRSQEVDLCFIRPNDALPLLHGPVAVFQGEVAALLDMPLQKSWLLFFGDAFSPASFKAQRALRTLQSTFVMSFRCRVTWTALSALAEVTIWEFPKWM